MEINTKAFIPTRYLSHQLKIDHTHFPGQIILKRLESDSPIIDLFLLRWFRLVEVNLVKV